MSPSFGGGRGEAPSKMTSIVLKIYQYMSGHKGLCLLLFLAISAFLVLQVTRVTYKEDISDFLPLEGRNQDALRVYQSISGANNMIAIFEHRDSAATEPEALIEAVEAFTVRVEADTVLSDLRMTSQIDIEQMTDVADFVQAHLPYFMQADDYQRIDSLLADPGYMTRQLQDVRDQLLMPGSEAFTDQLVRDPLGLFAPVMSRMQGASSSLRYEMYDGYIFSPDMKRAVVILASPYGSSETEHNGLLLEHLEACAQATGAEADSVEVHLTGGPVIAVGNAAQIKKDSIWSVAIAVAFILLLLLYTFRSVKNILLIVLSIGWGWLFGLGGLSLFHHEVSLIVLGISSVIIGIAVNYPLHLIAHLYHCHDVKSTLREIASPLIVGNITTVGAFLCLVPLDSVALRDLGLFSSFLLMGTILFVLLFLPHLARPHRPVHIPVLQRASDLRLENRRWLVGVVVVLTLVFGYFSLHTEFDSDMNHINYMSDEQKEDMDYFQKHMTKTSDHATLYLVSEGRTMEEALERSHRLQPLLRQLKAGRQILDYAGCSPLLAFADEQQQRLERWQQFTARYESFFQHQFRALAAREGFTAGTFDGFYDLLSADYPAQDFQHFSAWARRLFSSYLTLDEQRQRYEVVDILTSTPEQAQQVKERIEGSADGSYVFDVKSLNGTMARSLSDNFNYIGWACGLIVFFFLWFSLGSIELALLSFLPMAISWVWILGIMALLGIHFNIVNVILATFIFGQGDDYTIFMTEGCCYEYAYRRKMLASYKSSIIISALIMFVGIGSLIVARHPALHSLAEVTIVGMLSVVLMAYLFPPLIFNWLVKSGGLYRLRPLTLKTVCTRWMRRLAGKKEEDEATSPAMTAAHYHTLVIDRYRYKGVEVTKAVKSHLAKHHDYARWIDTPTTATAALIIDSGMGEFALLYALVHKDRKVWLYAADADAAALARHCAEGVADNLEVVASAEEAFGRQHGQTDVFLVAPTEETRQKYAAYQPVMVSSI